MNFKGMLLRSNRFLKGLISQRVKSLQTSQSHTNAHYFPLALTLNFKKNFLSKFPLLNLLLPTCTCKYSSMFVTKILTVEYNEYFKTNSNDELRVTSKVETLYILSLTMHQEGIGLIMV